MNNKKLVKARASYGPSSVQLPSFMPGYYDPTRVDGVYNYHQIIKECRYFYSKDPIAGTVINRMAAMSVTTLRNRWNNHTDAEKKFWTKLAKDLRAFLKSASIEYFVHGLVVPEYKTTTVLGRTFDPSFGRKRFEYPSEVWARNVEHIILRKRPMGLSRAVYMRVPPEDVSFIQSKGIYPDGTTDIEGYLLLVEEYPEYVLAVQNGVTIFPLNDVHTLMRNVVSYDDYPAPFLRNALDSLRHKEVLKIMDRRIANRAIDAIRHVKVGDKDFPADEEDIADASEKLQLAATTTDGVYNLITNHTWQIDWVMPALDVLTNEAKYAEPNADIFLAMGFPRVLTVGETAKSNSSDSKIALLGPVSVLNELRENLIGWIEWLYDRIAELNDLTPPQPYFSPIPVQDITALSQLASTFQTQKAISRDVIAQLYGSTFEEEAIKMKEEEEVLQELGLQSTQETENENPSNRSGNVPENEGEQA